MFSKTYQLKQVSYIKINLRYVWVFAFRNIASFVHITAVREDEGELQTSDFECLLN